ncbi:MAG: DNA recombination protein RmuC [Candidatus Kerfeldbacteria bacterium]|nr:DNA recombination protein RmuC [Candidatus Kerfeldbacteria bacterium]
MDIILIIIIIGVLIFNVVIFIALRDIKSKNNNDQGFVLLNQNVHGMQERLDNVSNRLNERLDKAAQVIGGVSKEIGQMQEIGRSMQGLQKLLQSPKLRGNIGEHVLEQMLEQNFPKSLYDTQFRFREGQIVDAIVRTEEGIIPLDSKFPMENYQRLASEETEEGRERYTKEFLKDVKKHINDIAKKYILPDQGTVDFAVMYIPSEAVYYEIIRNDAELHLVGAEKKVMFVSPNSLFYFLRVILMGMQGKNLNKMAKEIMGTIHGVKKDAERLGEVMQTLQSHVNHTKTAMDKVSVDYVKLAEKIERVDRMEETMIE